MHDLTDRYRELAITLAVRLHHEQFARSTNLDAARDEIRATASSIRSWLTTPDPDPAITALTERITALEDRMTSMEGRMDDTARAIAELNTETDSLAARIDQIIDTADADTAAALRPISDRLRSLAADPSEPVPVEPQPEPTPEPTPDQPV